MSTVPLTIDIAGSSFSERNSHVDSGDCLLDVQAVAEISGQCAPWHGHQSCWRSCAWAAWESASQCRLLSAAGADPRSSYLAQTLLQGRAVLATRQNALQKGVTVLFPQPCSMVSALEYVHWRVQTHFMKTLVVVVWLRWARGTRPAEFAEGNSSFY